MAKDVFQRIKPHVNVGIAHRSQRPILTAQMTATLRRFGLSHAGIHQALQGNVVADSIDREVISRILTAVAGQPHSAAEIYDYVGEYAQRFDGTD